MIKRETFPSPYDELTEQLKIHPLSLNQKSNISPLIDPHTISDTMTELFNSIR
jgi:hypothetical protein